MEISQNFVAFSEYMNFKNWYKNYYTYVQGFLKFIYSEKTTKFCEISTNYLSYLCTASQIIGGDFVKFCFLLRIYELYRYYHNFLWLKFMIRWLKRFTMIKTCQRRLITIILTLFASHGTKNWKWTIYNIKNVT